MCSLPLAVYPSAVEEQVTCYVMHRSCINIWGKLYCSGEKRSKTLSTFRCGVIMAALISISQPFRASLVERRLSYWTGPERRVKTIKKIFYYDYSQSLQIYRYWFKSSNLWPLEGTLSLFYAGLYWTAIQSPIGFFELCYQNTSVIIDTGLHWYLIFVESCSISVAFTYIFAAGVSPGGCWWPGEQCWLCRLSPYPDFWWGVSCPFSDERVETLLHLGLEVW